MVVPVPRTAATDDPASTAGAALQERRARAAERIAATLVWMLGIALLVGICWALGEVLLLVFAAALLACLLRGAADWFAAKAGGRPTWWLAAMIVAILAGLGGALWLGGGALAVDVKETWHQLRDQGQALWGRLGSVEWIKPVLDRVKTVAGEGSQRLAGVAAGLGTSTLGGIGSLVILVVAAVYFAIEPSLYVEGVKRLMPRPWRPRAETIMSDMAHTLRWWFVGQFIDMLAVGILTGIGLWLLGVKLALTLALIAGLCNLVPYVGALAGAVPAILVAFGQGPQTALYVGLLFVAVQALEGNVIAPLVQKSTVELAPVLTILSQTVLAALFGPLGLILATPLTAVGVVAVRKVYVEGILGDRDEAG